jgi:putative hydrolase of the HAD superfamily
MRDFKEFSGPMKGWPMVEAVPGAAEMLAALHPDWILAVATNADVSDEADIREALQRVDLDRWLDRIYCFKTIGHRKPSLEFFSYILDDLGLSPDQVVMVGDNYEADVLGANASGVQAVWFNERDEVNRQGKLVKTIHTLSELEACLP